MSVTILYKLAPAAGRAEVLTDLVQRVAAASRLNPDCLALRVFRAAGAPAPLVVIEEWSSAESHRAALADFSGELAEALVAAIDGPLEPLYLDPLAPADADAP